MSYETFEAPDIRRALAAVKAALGADAVIVSTRETPRRGLWRRPGVEITATRPKALESRQAVSAHRRYQATSSAQTPSVAAADDGATPAWAAETLAPRRDEDLSGSRALEQNLAVERRLAPLREELRAMRETLAAQREITHSQSDVAQADVSGTQTDAADPMLSRLGQQVSDEFTTLKRMLAAVNLGGASLGRAVGDANRAILEAADVDPEVAEALLADMGPGDDAGDALGATQRLEQAIAQAIPTQGAFFTPGQRLRVALVGPTGVGKTTTVAKIAAHAALKHQMKVALISLDTYRIGATEQIGHYARLVGVPMVTAHDRQSFVAALGRFEDYDLVLIDTAGRAPNQAAAHCLQLRQLFRGFGIEVYLTLAAATRRFERQDMLAAMGDLGALGARALILTKLDEAVALGSCLSLTHRTGLPLAFVTAGQRVPEDLAIAEAQALAARLIEKVLVSRTATSPREAHVHAAAVAPAPIYAPAPALAHAWAPRPYAHYGAEAAR